MSSSYLSNFSILTSNSPTPTRLSAFGSSLATSIRTRRGGRISSSLDSIDSSQMASSAILKIVPSVSMFDAPVRILVSGLAPGQKVNLTCKVADGKTGANFESVARYVADQNGEIDCARSEATGGTFTGRHPMGPFWSLQPTAQHKPGARILPINATTPVPFTIALRKESSNGILAETAINRYLLHPQVIREEVQHGRIRGTLFIPNPVPAAASPPKLPAIIDLYGTRGGLNEIRASLLASHGFATLALAYFNYKDLPDSFDDLELEYFEEAIQMLLRHPRVSDRGVGVLGTSFGAELALMMASYFPQVKAVVSVNGLHVLDSFNPINYKGKTLPTVSAEADTLEVVDGHLRYRSYRSKLRITPEDVFPIEKSRAQFLFVASEDDQSTPAVASFTALMQRLREHGKESRGELIVLPAAGHLLEPPYSPHTASLFHKVVGAPMLFGGEPMAHAEAQERTWLKIRRFFSEFLGPPAALNPIHELIPNRSKL